jgi:hypothetical protein
MGLSCFSYRRFVMNAIRQKPMPGAQTTTRKTVLVKSRSRRAAPVRQFDPFEEKAHAFPQALAALAPGFASAFGAFDKAAGGCNAADASDVAGGRAAFDKTTVIVALAGTFAGLAAHRPSPALAELRTLNTARRCPASAMAHVG